MRFINYNYNGKLLVDLKNFLVELKTSIER